MPPDHPLPQTNDLRFVVSQMDDSSSAGDEMSDDKKPSPEEVSRRQRWFEDHIRELRANSVVRCAEPGVRFAYPCCRCLTLEERGGYDICPVCPPLNTCELDP